MLWGRVCRCKRCLHRGGIDSELQRHICSHASGAMQQLHRCTLMVPLSVSSSAPPKPPTLDVQVSRGLAQAHGRLPRVLPPKVVLQEGTLAG